MTSRPAEPSLPRKVLFSLIPACVLLLALEGGLRLVGFEAPGVETMEFTFPLDEWRSDDGVAFLERDPVLFWRPRPNLLGHNSRGLFGPEFAVPKPEGLYRIVCLGDSCTHLGPRPYPQRFGEILEHYRPGRFEVINAGVLGWTSHQGLKRLETEVPEWQPDLVTVYFGWNDHWLAHGLRDSQQPVPAPWREALTRFARHLRTVQALALLYRPPARSSEPRVTLDEYAANLRAMKRDADRLGAEIWFLTAPQAFDRGVPRFLLESGEVDDPQKVLEVHRSYNQVVRRVGSELGVLVVDLEREIDAMAAEKEELFEPDHIHLSDNGRTLVAAMLYARMLDLGKLDSATD